jgi:hypothetical protein
MSRASVSSGCCATGEYSQRRERTCIIGGVCTDYVLNFRGRRWSFSPILPVGMDVVGVRDGVGIEHRD